MNLQKLRQPRKLRHIWRDQVDAINGVQLYIFLYKKVRRLLKNIFWNLDSFLHVVKNALQQRLQLSTRHWWYWWVLPPLQQVFITKLDNIELGKVVSASSPGPVQNLQVDLFEEDQGFFLSFYFFWKRNRFPPPNFLRRYKCPPSFLTPNSCVTIFQID